MFVSDICVLLLFAHSAAFLTISFPCVIHVLFFFFSVFVFVASTIFLPVSLLHFLRQFSPDFLSLNGRTASDQTRKYALPFHCRPMLAFLYGHFAFHHTLRIASFVIVSGVSEIIISPVRSYTLCTSFCDRSCLVRF